MNGRPAADIGVAKTVDNASPPVATMATFTVTADEPRGPVRQPASSSRTPCPWGSPRCRPRRRGSYTSPTWTVGDLNVGTPATLTIVASVDAPGALVNQAQKTQQTEADPNPTNDSASVSLERGGLGESEDPQDRRHRHEAVGSASAMTFNIVVVNQGPSPATGVTVSDVLPPGIDVRLRGSRLARTTRPPASGPSALSEWRPAPCSP